MSYTKVDKQDFNTAIRLMKIHPTIIQTDTGEYPTGEFAIFDEEKQLVRSTIKRRNAFIQNADLFNLIWMHQGTTCTNIYTSAGGETFGFDGYFPEILMTKVEIRYRLGFNIMNSYAGRFLPTITFNIFDMEDNIIIRSNISIFESFSKINFDTDRYWMHDAQKKIMLLFLFASRSKIDYHALKGYFSSKIYPYFDKYVPLYMEKHDSNAWGAYKLVALLTKQWIKTSYEVAVNTQKKLFKVIGELSNER